MNAIGPVPTSLKNLFLDLLERKLAEGAEDKLVEYALDYLRARKKEIDNGGRVYANPTTNEGITRILRHLEAIPAKREQFEKLAKAFKEVCGG